MKTTPRELRITGMWWGDDNVVFQIWAALTRMARVEPVLFETSIDFRLILANPQKTGFDHRYVGSVGL